jgi:serine/alanine adding enzyme
MTVDPQPAQAEWDGFVHANASATAYHQWGWREVFTGVFGHQCVYLAAKERSTIVGVLPLVVFDSWVFGRFGVSLPFVNYGGVISESDVAAEALLAAAGEVARSRRLSHIELRHVQARFPRLPAKHHKVAMNLALPGDHDGLWQQLDRKVRNQVRKAEKSDLTVTVGGAELLPDFYSVFAHNMRDLGTPVYSSRFFAAILTHFPDTCRVFVVRQGSRAIAASMTVRWRDTLEVPWASALRDFRALSPNMLLYWAMLKHAVEIGCRTFDFGRSTPDEGTFHFKRQWGAEPTPVSWEYVLAEGTALPDQSPKNPKFRLAIEAWKRLPVPVATMLGPAIVRSIP